MPCFVRTDRYRSSGRDWAKEAIVGRGGKVAAISGRLTWNQPTEQPRNGSSISCRPQEDVVRQRRVLQKRR